MSIRASRCRTLRSTKLATRNFSPWRQGLCGDGSEPSMSEVEGTRQSERSSARFLMAG